MNYVELWQKSHQKKKHIIEVFKNKVLKITFPKIAYLWEFYSSFNNKEIDFARIKSRTFNWTHFKDTSINLKLILHEKKKHVAVFHANYLIYAALSL